jgi:SAM-dependent methyltransferase
VANLVGPEGEVVGIDPLPLRVDIASRREGNFRAQVGRAEDLSAFADGSFDVVYLNSVFHWVADKPKALSEIRRVLRRGGRLGVNSADASRPHQSAAILRELLLEEGLGDHNSGTNLAVDADGVRRLLDAAGFVQVEVRNHLFVDFHDNVDELLAWSRSSSFGNFLTNLGPEGKAQIRDRLAARLEPLRTPNGIRLERYLVFATAAKPG